MTQPDVVARKTDAAPPRSASSAVAALVLVALALGCFYLHHALSRTDGHSYSAGASAPYDVRLTAGHTYGISVHGGVSAATALGVSPGELSCTLSSGSGESNLTLTAEQTSTKAINQIATFISPATGIGHVSCSGLPSVFVDDADDAGFDLSGLLLLLGIAVLVVVLPWQLAAVHRAVTRR